MKSLSFKYILVLITVFIFSNPTYSQTQNPWVNEVFNNIINAIGNYSINAPNLEIVPDGRKMAFLSPKKQTIFIDQQVLDICRKYGKDSSNTLAFLLGHELTHHYMGHSWITKDDKSDYKGFSFMENIKYFNKDSTKRLEMETQADLKGGFYSFLGGYDALNPAIRLLDTLYVVYKVPKAASGYPNLSERKSICETQINKLERLKSIFNASTYALMAGYYQGAEDGFNKILSEGFNSREIYNNLGLTYLLHALKEMDNKEILAYPFEYDAKSRLNDVSTRGGISSYTNSGQIKMLIDNAIKKFQHAKRLDPDYKSAQLNICCAYSLLAELYAKDEGENEKYIKKALDALDSYNMPEMKNTYILEGIISNQKGEKKLALKNFKKAVKIGSEVAQINIDKVNDTESENKTTTAASTNQEILDQFKSGGIMAGFSDFPEPYTTIKLNNCKLYVKEFENSTAYLFSSRNRFFIQTTRTQSTSTGINIGDDVEKLVSKYHNPSIVRGTIDDYHQYPNNNIVFMEKNHKISGWFLYKSND